MEKIMNKTFFFIFLLFCCCTICLGQNNNTILLKYSLAKREFKKMRKDICFPKDCFQDSNYRKIVRYDTLFNKSDTLYIILPDNREHEKQGKVDVVYTTGTRPRKKNFFHSVEIRTEKRVIVLKCNWYTLTFEKKKGNKYELKYADKDDFQDYLNWLNGLQKLNSSY